MRKIFLLFCVILPSLCFSQENLKKLRTGSWQAFAYKINAADAEKYRKWDSIPLDVFLTQQPAMIFNADSVEEDRLPLGNYVLISVNDYFIRASMINISDLILQTINNGQKLQFDIRTRQGMFVNNAKVFVAEKEAVFKTTSHTFWSNWRSEDDALVKVYAPGDTLYWSVSESGDYDRTIAQQRRQIYHEHKIYKYLNWLPSQWAKLFEKKNTFRKSSYPRPGGYVIFNQPKYKPIDTVRYKAYLLDRNKKPFTKNIEVHLQYYDRRGYQNQLLETLKPASPGAYFSSFVLADTLPSDRTYKLSFQAKKAVQLTYGEFKMEDYVLSEIASYNFRKEKETYYPGDSIRFFAEAKDANGLNVMDATASLLLTTRVIDKAYRDTLFVYDTLYANTVKLDTRGPTKFVVPADILPDANLTIDALLTFKNSNNEIQTRQESFSYQYRSVELLITQVADSIITKYTIDGKVEPASGTMTAGENRKVRVNFPLKVKIDPQVDSYRFSVDDKGNTTETFWLYNNYNVWATSMHCGDTLGLGLVNPYRIPVYYTVFRGNEVIASARDTAALITWSMYQKDPHRMYTVKWQYIWKGEEQNNAVSLGLDYEWLNFKISTSSSVYPGQKDSVKIDIADYKGKPAPEVNLTAVSYNNQFSKDIKYPHLPYTRRSNFKRGLVYPKFESDDRTFSAKSYRLGKNTAWIDLFHLDTMTYYKLLFPKQCYFDAQTLISDFIPQVSVNVVKNGTPQSVCLLYINRQLVYWNGVTDRMPYAFKVMPGMTQFSIRTPDAYMEFDSIYIQPNYKHDLSFDLNKLSKDSKITTQPATWSDQEINLLESTMWQMRNDQPANATVWQNDRVVNLSSGTAHIAGPFRREEMTFFNPGKFDISFQFEPGYQYSLSPLITRLEKMSLFPDKSKLYTIKSNFSNKLLLGDTVQPPPVIQYKAIAAQRYLPEDENATLYNYYTNARGKGKLQFTKVPDSALRNVILVNVTSVDTIVLPISYNRIIGNIPPGKYSLLLVTHNFYTAVVDDLNIRPDGTLVVDAGKAIFTAQNDVVDELFNKLKKFEEARDRSDYVSKTIEVQVAVRPAGDIILKKGGGSVSGTVVDIKTDVPVPFATVSVSGYGLSVSTDADGRFLLAHLRKGAYELSFTAAGYKPKLIKVTIEDGKKIPVRAALEMSLSQLSEVIVTTSLGRVRQKQSIGYASATISSKELTMVNAVNGLAGKVSGLNIQTVNSGELGGTRISLRDIRSLTSDNSPLLVVDGIIMRLQTLSSIDPNNIEEISILTSEQATAIYGSDGVAGAVLVKTKAANFRKKFRDYAAWEPNFFTDKNGHAGFVINYPDNVTGWQTFVIGIDKKGRVGKSSVITQAYKPIVAQLSVPQFLVEGDSVSVIGKSLNYTDDVYQVQTNFKTNGRVLSESTGNLAGNDALISEQMIGAKGTDSVKIDFNLQTSTGFKDGEQRVIPTVKQGTQESVGNFWMFQNDTTVSFTAAKQHSGLHLYAQNNTLDVLLNAIDQLKEYPFACMEQTASKLAGLIMEKKIKATLKEEFKDQKMVDRLLLKLQKGQSFEGGWPWWEGGPTNLYITAHVTKTLLLQRENPLVETNIRNAFLYLQNNLFKMSRNELLAALAVMSDGRHALDYKYWLAKIKPDSLEIHQQWQYVKVCRQQQIIYQPMLDKLVARRKQTMLGGVHWGEENYSWYRNEMATTVIAYEILKEEPQYRSLLQPILQYFLEKRNGGSWGNTVEAASVLQTILPDILAQQKNFRKDAMVRISGDTNFVMNVFPAEVVIKDSSVQKFIISKAGGGFVYFTAWQNVFNTAPLPVRDKFDIQTAFVKNGSIVSSITSGEKITMQIKVDVLKDADYVMIEVPLPAGCIYAEKSNRSGNVYKEFYKDKLMMFFEYLRAGQHIFEILLEPRYNGTFTLNPVKAELMYFPVFFGRNEMKQMIIQK